MQVRQPSGAPPVAPLGAEHDQVEGVHRLHLAPGLAASTGLVGGGQRLHHRALVAGIERVDEHGLPDLWVVGRRRRQTPGTGDPVERVEALGQRQIDQVVAVDVQHVEEERPQCTVAHRVLEHPGAAVVADGERLAVEHHARHRQRTDHLDDARHPAGDLVEVARPHLDPLALAVHLDADAVELPFDRDRRRDRLGHRGSGRGEHRLQRSTELESHRLHRGDPSLRSESGDGVDATSQHDRSADDGGRYRPCHSDRVEHHSFRGSLTQLSPEQEREEPGFLGGRRAEQRSQQRAALDHRARARQHLQRRDRPVDVEHGQRRRPRGWLLGVGEAAPTDPDAALSHRAGQEADDRLDLVDIEACQQLGDGVAFGRPRRRRGDRRRGGGDIGEEHPLCLVLLAGWFSPPRPRRSPRHVH